ncbi:MAG: ATP-binding cassette domain-containing protein [Candidatus Lokiarchaeota archaeon]|nr:ATP-binding cassette domain-containing protein [Candidatus Lokiarchaeota archaeon]MBD3198987.1 ATP-binding cassette domain-containing protein [Candidatus Lokiarchaeota archaeon]
MKRTKKVRIIKEEKVCLMGDAICVNGVTVTYGDVVALWQINLDISEGEYIGIAGPNASGKTTLFKTILGLIDPVEGQVRVYGKPIGNLRKKLLNKIAYVPQAHQIEQFFPAKVKDVVLMGRYGFNFLGSPLRSKDYQKMEEELKFVGMYKQRNRPIGHLSGGQQQKALIARALVRDPEILMLDEPTSNLDFKITKEITDLITQLHDERELTVLTINHNLDLLREDIDRLVVLNKTIVYDGPPYAEKVDEILYQTFF